MAPLISVIIPIYNAQAYLKKCLDSIITQTYSNLEIIAINDGSSDNSLNICHEYASLNPRIKIIDKKNGGVSSARNAGLSAASGDWITFVDSDDWIEPNMCAEFIRIIQSYPECDMVIFDIIAEIHKDFFEYNKSFDYDFKIFNSDEIRNILCDAVSYKPAQSGSVTPFAMCSCKFFNKNILNGIFFPSDISYGEDTIFVLNALCNANAIAYSNQFMYNYNFTDTSVTKKIDAGFIQKISTLDEHIEDFCRITLKNPDVYQKYLNSNYLNKVKFLLAYYIEVCTFKEFRDYLAFFKSYIESVKYQNALKSHNLTKNKEKLFVFLYRHKLYTMIFFIRKIQIFARKLKADIK